MKNHDRWNTARSRLLMDAPFFSMLTWSLRHLADPSVPTACTNGREIRYNPDFVAKLSPQETVTLLAHEVCHPAMGHIFRRGSRDPKLWNFAADQEVDWLLESMNEAAREKGVPIPFPWPLKRVVDHPVPDPKYRGWAAERVYADVVQQQGGGEGSPSPSQPGAGQSGNAAPAPSDPSDPSATSDSSPQGAPSWGDFTDAPGTEAEQALAADQWKNALANALRVAKARGSLPAGLEKLVAALIEPPISLEERLRAFYLDRVREDYSWLTPNRRYLSAGFYLPSLDSRRMGDLVLAVDSSGSITEEEWAAFLSLVNHVTVDCQPRTTLVLICDARIQAVHEFERGDAPAPDQVKLVGGGGTDFRPVFQHVENENLQPTCLIYFTDLDGRFPDEEPAYPVLWVTNSKRTTVPFGELVHFP